MTDARQIGLFDDPNADIELGPGAALSGFMKRIDKGAVCLSVSNVATLEATVRALGV